MQATQLKLFNSDESRILSRPVKFKFVDFFAGIGGFRIPLESLGGKCLGFSEIDREAIKVYKKNFLEGINQDELELGDITHITSLPKDTELLVGGVPCQPWSVAGKLQGFQDPRGKLWFDVIRLVKKTKPKAFIFENVKGLANPKNKIHLEKIIKDLKGSEYYVYWDVVNSYDFGVPQNRERVFIVGIRKDIKGSENYKFPSPIKYKPKLKDVIYDIKEIEITKKAKVKPKILFGDCIPPSRNRFQKDDELNDFFVFSDLRNGHTTIHSWDLIQTSDKEKHICLTLLKNRRRKKYGMKDGNPLSFDDLRENFSDILPKDIDSLVQKKILKSVTINDEDKYDFVNSKNSSGIGGIYRIFLPQSDMIPTLTATGTKDYIATETIYAEHPKEYKKLFIEKIYQQHKFRPITGQDACQLQGFPQWFEIHPSECIAKKQFGNAVSVPVVLHVANNLIKILGDSN